LEKYIENCNNNASIPVIIFDEIEKSHPKIHDLFLELLDEGKVTLLN
jgi:ATP-dependent Clp protease ATP-binding subunit ClpA